VQLPSLYSEPRRKFTEYFKIRHQLNYYDIDSIVKWTGIAVCIITLSTIVVACLLGYKCCQLGYYTCFRKADVFPASAVDIYIIDVTRRGDVLQSARSAACHR
jgi:hypothetical protein